MRPNSIVYLTGAPATGKTTTASFLAERSSLTVYSYGAMLAESLSHKVQSQHELRRDSAGVVDPQDVANLDTRLAALIASGNQAGDILIDSHAVTIETYGFRAVPYGSATLSTYGITHIVCLYASSSVLSTRIAADPQGRPMPSERDLDLHNSLQCSLALAYSHTLGIPAFFIDSGRPVTVVAEAVARTTQLEIALP